MSDAAHAAAFPRAPLLAAAALVAASLLAVAVVRTTGVGRAVVANAPAVASAALRFADGDDGSITVSDARDGRVVATVEPGTNGFLRGTLRGLVRERKRAGLGPEEPFVLQGRADGRLTLVDPATGRRVDLESFGPTNAAVFAHLLAAAPAR